jgi:hypothetical protein
MNEPQPPLNPLRRALDVVSLIAVGISFFYLYKHALGGYHQIAPVYIFAVAIVVCASTWGYLITRWMRRLFADKSN